MNVKSFLKLVEIQTKVASMVPFALGSAYVFYRFHVFNALNCVLMLVSLLFVDMATTTINNLLDYKKANKKEGYGFEKHNAIVKYNMKESTVVGVIVALMAVAVTFGLLLFVNTNFNLIILALGGASFLVGVVYSFGPIPISRTPFGELFSGGFMGLIIPFLAVYIHIYDQNLIGFAIDPATGLFTLSLQLRELAYIFLLSVPVAAGIANIMLANNICDMEEDLENHRYTLPIYIGKTKALRVFSGLYVIGYAAILALVVFGGAPIICLLTLATIPIVVQHLKIFYKKQTKQETFGLSVKNLLLMNVILTLSILIAIVADVIF